MTDKTDHSDATLEALFEEARRAPPPVPEGLMSAVLADAAAHQPRAQRGAWAAWVQATGGIAGMAGLATAACVGLWIGIAPPQVLPDLGGIVLGLDTTSEVETTAFGWDIEEG